MNYVLVTVLGDLVTFPSELQATQELTAYGRDPIGEGGELSEIFAVTWIFFRLPDGADADIDVGDAFHPLNCETEYDLWVQLTVFAFPS